MSRRKQIKEGLASVRKQIELHEAKRRKAEKEGNAFLAEYYEKEISQLKREVERREKLLTKNKRKSR